MAETAGQKLLTCAMGSNLLHFLINGIFYIISHDHNQTIKRQNLKCSIILTYSNFRLSWNVNLIFHLWKREYKFMWERILFFLFWWEIGYIYRSPTKIFSGFYAVTLSLCFLSPFFHLSQLKHRVFECRLVYASLASPGIMFFSFVAWSQGLVVQFQRVQPAV